MQTDLLYRARVRKSTYITAIIVLFLISLMWRGVLPVPFSGSNAVAASLSKNTLLAKADSLDLRELDQGDPNVATSAAQYSLIGIRGPIITILWWAAIEKQKRNEWDELQQLVDLITHLQPNFITPWIFQSWNIAYNVSVENEKLADMYYYISQGISLLAKGDRVNTKTYRPRDAAPVEVGSPDIRYQIAFYYQNKFGVSDKVSTLRSLMQLSCIKPGERDPDSLLQNKTVDQQRFLEFCTQNPQLVRRLRTKLNCATPKDVIDFLRMNQNVPTRYKRNGDLEAPATQFPVLPPKFSDSDDYNPTSPTTDTFDAFHAARAWFGFAQSVVPPPPEGEPTSAPRRGKNEYDEFRYRIPQRPALVIFRTGPARAQHYLAERLTKEGWFTSATEWDPDAYSDTRWFQQPVRLKAGDSAQQQWIKAHAMWSKFGDINGLTRAIVDDTLANAMFPTGELPPPASDFSDEELDRRFPPSEAFKTDEERRARARKIITAHRAVIFYRQNQSITNFRYFLDTSAAEATPEMTQARTKQWEAEQALLAGNRITALQYYAESLVYWREACRKSPAYHSHEIVQENMFDIENAISQELRREAPKPIQPALAALVPQLPEADGADLFQLWVEDMANRRVVAATPDPSLQRRVDEVVHKLGPASNNEASRNKVRLELIDGEFAWMKRYTTPDMTVPWIRPDIRDQSKLRLGLKKPPTQPPASVVPTSN